MIVNQGKSVDLDEKSRLELEAAIAFLNICRERKAEAIVLLVGNNKDGKPAMQCLRLIHSIDTLESAVAMLESIAATERATAAAIQERQSLTYKDLN